MFNPLTNGVTTLGIAPDARGGSMGDLGVATDPDVNSQYWNPSKYAYAYSSAGVSVSYTPWLRKLVNDINLAYVADMSVYEGKNIPAGHVRYLCGQDAAGYAENVNLYTAGHGLKSITRGSAPEAELLEALGLDPGRYFLALAQTVGK